MSFMPEHRVVFISMFMMGFVMSLSAPTETVVSHSFTPTPSSSTLDKLILRNQEDEDNTPRTCCTDPSKKCCPYDFDGSKCEKTDSRTLCGYNKNQKKQNSDPVHFTKMGLDCRVVDERFECGYDKGSSIPDSVTESKTKETTK